MSNTLKIFEKLFVKRFYKENAGLFFFLFILFLSSLLYINALDKVPPAKRLYWNLIMTIKLMTNPYLSVFIVLLFLFYIYKMLLFLKVQFSKEENNFLFNCVGAYSFKQLFWLLNKTFFLLLLPLYSYVIFSMIVGQFFGFWKLPMAYFLGTIILHLTLNGTFSEYLIRGFSEKKSAKNGSFLKMLNGHRLLLFESILDSGKLMLSIAKVISMIFIFYSFQNQHDQWDGRLISLGAIFVVLTHSLLLFQTYKYAAERLVFRYNFSLSFGSYYFEIIKNFGPVLLPEFLIVFIKFGVFEGLTFMLITLSFILFIWNMLHLIGVNIRKYFKQLFIVSVIDYLLILYHLEVLVAALHFVIAFYISKKCYHCEEITSL